MNDAADRRANAAATAFSKQQDPQVGPGYRSSSRPSAAPAAPAPPPAPAPASAAPADDLFSLFDDATAERAEPADTPDFEQITAREQALLTEALRSDPPSAAELLHPSCAEVGASGRRLDREEILAHLAPLDRVEAAEVVADQIAPGVVPPRYVTSRPPRPVQRTSDAGPEGAR